MIAISAQVYLLMAILAVLCGQVLCSTLVKQWRHVLDYDGPSLCSVQIAIILVFICAIATFYQWETFRSMFRIVFGIATVEFIIVAVLASLLNLRFIDKRTDRTNKKTTNAEL